ncbi:hypothetical protein DPMN_138876 [Dreissena polymorpha]|uniref:Uncharacterized protein n=1 Tax=Dreissena polymorpha TaxID=45954 RepID=A0A9D4G512_DREPO|nr:hypothetical protein DPMN_138876 [Dreissena polymorpha]
MYAAAERGELHQTVRRYDSLYERKCEGIFFSDCYGNNDIEKISITTYKTEPCASRVGKSSKALQSLASLSLTTEAFYAKVKRVHIQAC